MNKIKILIRKIKILVLISIIISVYYIGSASAFVFWDWGDPDISVEILTPDEFMPNSTYYIGIKYIVKKTSYDPALDPKIIFNIQNGKVIGKLNGIFTVINTSQSCTFSLAGNIEKGMNETVVVIIKTDSSGIVNMDVEASTHDTDDYENIIKSTDSSNVPILKLDPNSIEFFKELANQRKILFETIYDISNGTRENKPDFKVSDNIMNRALLGTMSLSYNVLLNEEESNIIDPVIGLPDEWDYVDFGKEMINGFNDTPWMAWENYMFGLIDEMLGYLYNTMEKGQIQLECVNSNFFSFFNDGLDQEHIKEYADLLGEEEKAWEDKDFNKLIDILNKEEDISLLLWDSGFETARCIDEFCGIYNKDVADYYKIVYSSLEDSAKAEHESTIPMLKDKVKELSKVSMSAQVSMDKDTYDLSESAILTVILKDENLDYVDGASVSYLVKNSDEVTVNSGSLSNIENGKYESTFNVPNNVVFSQLCFDIIYLLYVAHDIS